ncbi:MAG: C13 family peptidase [Pseudomonadota bacterium]
MIKRVSLGLAIASLFAVPALSQSSPEPAGNPNQPPAHTIGIPDLSIGSTRSARQKSFEQSPQFERGFDAKDLLDQRRRLDAALGAMAPQRAGVVDAYVVTVALDSDPVFAREAREAGRVLGARFDASGRTLTLAGPDGARDDLPRGSIDTLLVSLAAIAEKMDREEDVLVMYTSSHGLKLGLAYHYGDQAFGVLSPTKLAEALEELGIERRVLILSACYSGVFVPALAGDNSAIFTAAADTRTSFGCVAENDWTFYGDAMINRALRKPQPLDHAAQEAARTVAGWEVKQRLLASLPQSSIGSGVSDWLPALEARMPQTASAPVGRPAVPE